MCCPTSFLPLPPLHPPPLSFSSLRWMGWGFDCFCPTTPFLLAYLSTKRRGRYCFLVSEGFLSVILSCFTRASFRPLIPTLLFLSLSLSLSRVCQRLSSSLLRHGWSDPERLNCKLGPRSVSRLVNPGKRGGAQPMYLYISSPPLTLGAPCQFDFQSVCSLVHRI